jgi:hypothetical protein
MRLLNAAVLFASLVSCSRAPASAAELAERARVRADEMHERAIRQEAFPSRVERAAQLHRESARLRPPSDPRAFECYAQAAAVLAAANRFGAARTMMQESADFALSRADTLAAARSYAYAAALAASQASPALVEMFAARATKLSHSSAVLPTEMDEIDAQVTAALQLAHANASRPRVNAR